MDSNFLKKIIESNKKVIETKLKNAKRIEESNNTLLELNSGKIITPIITKKEDELTIDDSHISPPEKFNNYIKKNFGIQGKWRIEGKGLNIFYNSQPQTLDAMKPNINTEPFTDSQRHAIAHTLGFIALQAKPFCCTGSQSSKMSTPSVSLSTWARCKRMPTTLARGKRQRSRRLCAR